MTDPHWIDIGSPYRGLRRRRTAASNVMIEEQGTVLELTERLNCNAAAYAETLEGLRETIGQLLSATSAEKDSAAVDGHGETPPRRGSSASGPLDNLVSFQGEILPSGSAEFPDEEYPADELHRRLEAHRNRPWADKLLRSMLPTEMVVRDAIFPTEWNTGRKFNSLNMISDFDERGYVCCGLQAAASDEAFWEYIRVRTPRQDWPPVLCSSKVENSARLCRGGSRPVAEVDIERTPHVRSLGVAFVRRTSVDRLALQQSAILVSAGGPVSRHSIAEALRHGPNLPGLPVQRDDGTCHHWGV